jgi:LmbE family N-acetylglucosaminyl deacetylase
MQPLLFAKPGQTLKVLCLGAHSDDIEIGAGGTLLGWIDSGLKLDVHWCVLSARGPRRAEAMAGADAVLRGAATRNVECGEFRDGYFPYEGAEVKSWIEDLKTRMNPDIVFTHRGDDAHQDHREVSRLTWNAFRDHTILEYEIPKWDGDLGRVTHYLDVPAECALLKVETLDDCFPSQRSRKWWSADTFLSIMRLRGIECRREYAEGFVVEKAEIVP